MPRRSRRSVESLIEELNSQLQASKADHYALGLRESVLRMVDLYRDVKDLGVSMVREHGLESASARGSIQQYLLAHVGERIHGAELEVVSGISEYARRVRELRKEQGYQIATGASPDPESGIVLRPDEYMLVSGEPDLDAARRWKVANRIRRLKVGSRDRLLAFLQENVGRVVTTEELAYVAREARSFPRRIRELRTEHGYAVATRFTGRPDLGVGQYILESAERIAEPHDRNIPEEIQKQVYERDRNSCQTCGWTRPQWTRADPRFLELHHVDHHKHGGANTSDNLLVLCSVCHDRVHAGSLNIPRR